MTPVEVLDVLNKQFKVRLDRRSLLNYEKAGLIPTANRDVSGVGGKRSDYPPETVEEAYASYALMHGQYNNKIIVELFGRPPNLTFLFVAEIRAYALYPAKSEERMRHFSEKMAKEINYNADMTSDIDIDTAMQLISAFATIWNNLRHLARSKKFTP